MDSIDSLRPSSLPPELASLDVNWDDDPRSVGAIDLLQSADLDLDVDAGERTTAVPGIPIDQLVQATMAEADARELAESAENAACPPQNAGSTQPAPSRSISPLGRTTAPTLQLDESSGSARAWPEATQPPSARPPFALEQRFSAPPTARGTDLDGLRHQMKDLYATGDFSGALKLAETLLEADSGDLDAQRFATSCRDVLTQMLMSRIGSFEQIVEVLLTPEELRWLTLDHRAGFFLSLVDGLLTIEELLDISGMPRLESLRILSTLVEQRVLRLVPH